MEKQIFLSILFLALGLYAEPLELKLGSDGTVSVGDAGVTLGMSIHHEGWKSTSHGARRDFAPPDAESGTAVIEFYTEKQLCARGRSSLRADGREAVIAAEVTSTRDQRPEDVVLSLELPMATIAGGSWATDTGKHGTFNPKWDGKTVMVFSATISRFTLNPAKGAAFSIAFPRPTSVMLQDNRTWGQSFTLRIRPEEAHGRAFNSGDRRSFACRIASPKGTRVLIDHGVTILAGDDWIPLDYRKDIEAGSALDFSNMGLLDAPAGKYGWIKNDQGHFAFERRPRHHQRFYGVNLCFTACFPDHALADRLVTRLTRLGYNAMRFHHYERGLVEGSADGLTFNAENLDRLDYLLAKCREKGIYATTDLFTSRPVTWRAIGIDRDGHVEQQVYKNMVLVHEPAFENWKAFTRNLLNHVNPYTGLAYKNDPALPLISLINEGTILWCWDRIRTEAALQAAWRKWLACRRAADRQFAKGVSDDPTKVRAWGNSTVVAFAADLERDFVKRAKAFLKDELGVRALLTNQNCSGADKPMMSVRRDLYEYVDTHFYVDHPKFLEKQWSLPSKCQNRNPVQAKRLAPVAVADVRVAEQPFTVTEWNFSGPGMYRGVGGIMTGAVAALQDWDGLWRFAYSHSRDNLEDGKGVPGYFDVGTDPLGQAGDRASVCLFLRGDLDVVGCGANPSASAALRIDRTRGVLALNTARTAGGFTPAGRLASGAVAFDCGTVPTTLWASAVDALPLAKSRRILVSHLTDVQANGNRYADTEKRILLKWGGTPPLVRNGTARVELAVEHPEAFTVWALTTSGHRQERIASQIVAGKLVFTAAVKGPQGARMLYEIAASK